MILRIAKRIFVPIAIGFLVYFAWESRDLLFDIVRNARPTLLLLSVLVWMIMHALGPLLSTLIFRARKVPISYSTAAAIHIRNLPARYLPGGIWHTVGRISGFRELDISQRDISIFVFLENVLAVCTAFLIGGSLLVATRGFVGWGKVATIAACAGGALLLATPFILSVRKFTGESRFPTADYILVASTAGVSWCVAATSFVYYLSAFPDLVLDAQPLEIAGAYLFSWGVGFISILTPQGVGVFEVVAADLVHASGHFMSVAALIAGFRLVVLIADLVVWATHLLISPRGSLVKD